MFHVNDNEEGIEITKHKFVFTKKTNILKKYRTFKEVSCFRKSE